MAYGVIVEGDLYCRAQPNSGATSYGKFSNGTRLTVADAPGAPDWWQTTWTSGSTGYVMKRYVVSAGDTIQIKGSSVNVRPTASTSQTELYRLSNPETAPVIDVATGTDGGWIKIQPSGKAAGWVRYDLVIKYTSGSGGGPGGGTGVNTATWAEVKNGSAVYKKESSGSAVCDGVKTLQQYLQNIGYGANNSGAIVVDGNFGSITETAVKLFQAECGFTADGIVGQTTANKLEQAQSDPYFLASEFFPLKSSFMTYNNFPAYSGTKRERSVIVRAINAEHGYGNYTGTGHKAARVGVAKVMKNRLNHPNYRRYNSSDYSYRSLFFGPDYSTHTHTNACYPQRGCAGFADIVYAADTILAGGWPQEAPLVTTDHYNQRGKSADSTTYRAKPGWCRYPETGDQWSFFFKT